MANRTLWVEAYRKSIMTLLSALDDLRDKRLMYDALGLSGALVDGDVPAGLGLKAVDITTAVASVQALTDLLAANGNAHASNLYKLKD